MFGDGIWVGDKDVVVGGIVVFGKEEEVCFYFGFLYLEYFGVDIGLLGDSVIDDKGLNIEGIGVNLCVV